MNILNVLQKIPGIVEQEQKRTDELQKDLPMFREVVNGEWKKGDQLSRLKPSMGRSASTPKTRWPSRMMMP